MKVGFAELPEPPYWAVIFSSRLHSEDPEYAATAERMTELAAQQPGFLGVETARSPDGFGMTVSYWRDEASIAAWKQQAEHAAARSFGRERWYQHFELRIARVERAYGKPRY